MAKALYRKYRPLNLSQLIGQEQVKQILASAIESKSPSHAYLFIGPRGTGKTSAARIFAHAINDFPYKLESNPVDIIEIDAASNTGVENIRDLKESAIISPTQGKYKVYIIDEVHMLSKSAFNALLKTLEEPPHHVVFLLATTDAHKVPITITSRVQALHFKLLDQDTIVNHLRNIATKEHIEIEDDALHLIAKKGGGSFRDSISLLDQVSTLPSRPITADLINSAFGLPAQQLIEALLNYYQTSDTDAIHQHLLTIFQSGLRLETLIEDLIYEIIHHPNPKLLTLLSRLSLVSPPFLEAKILLSFLSPDSPSDLTSNPSISAAIHTPTKITPTPQKTISQAAPLNPTTPIVAATSTPAAAPIPNHPNLDSEFNLEQFKSALAAKNKLLSDRIHLAKLKIDHHHLHVYPDTKAAFIILNSKNNLSLLASLLPANFSLTIHDLSGDIQPSPLSAISAIMGETKEVNQDVIDSPF